MTMKTTLKLATALTCLLIPLLGLSNAEERAKTMNAKAKEHAHTNRLINETSPYLLQHAHNPVDWYPWSQEALDAAKKLDKPIFLSIGYSTCHWCHVMERESFEDEKIAKIMNEHFICIKVDREQRPDVDAVYMNAVQMMTGSGGWPLSAFLTPDGKPFYGGTYFPPTDMYGRPGFETLLLAIADAWENKRDKLTTSAGKISAALEGLGAAAAKQELSADVLKRAYGQFRNAYDPAYGGFGRAPKFPQPTNLSMLLGYYHRTAEPDALEMVETTLEKMATAGIYDHLGGGFHRYSTDAKWLVPHFEKMLYDQALLARAYIQAYQITGNPLYAKTVRETFDYVLRDMTDPKGGFYSAEDADSEGKEGWFYVWEPEETEKLLGKQNAEIFDKYYGVTKKGNFEERKSILNITGQLEEVAKQFKKEPAEIETILALAREKLFNHREKRPRPHRDDKVIVAWNGLMISSMAYGGAVLEEPKYIDAAEKAADFALTALRPEGRLARYYRDGKTIDRGFLDDYAFMIMGLLDLYEATFDARWIKEAKSLAQQMIDLFGDEKSGSFFLTGKDAERLIVRNKPSYDGAVPSGNSIAAFALLRLGQLTMDRQFTDRAEKLLDSLSARMSQSPMSLTAALIALDFHLGPTKEIVIAGDLNKSDTKEMLKVIRGTFLPNAVILVHQLGPAGKPIEKEVPFVAMQMAIDDKATAYVCENYMCQMPVITAAELKDMLKPTPKKTK